MPGERDPMTDLALRILNRVRRDLGMVTDLIHRARPDGDEALLELMSLHYDILRGTVKLELGEPFKFPNNDRPQEEYMTPSPTGQTEVTVVE